MSVTEEDQIITTLEYTGVIPGHRNLFRFPDSPVRFRVKVTGSDNSTDMVCLSEPDFDGLDVSVTGRPTTYCVLSPGLAACWPTTDQDYTVSILFGAP